MQHFVFLVGFLSLHRGRKTAGLMSGWRLRTSGQKEAPHSIAWEYARRAEGVPARGLQQRDRQAESEEEWRAGRGTRKAGKQRERETGKQVRRQRSKVQRCDSITCVAWWGR